MGREKCISFRAFHVRFIDTSVKACETLLCGDDQSVTSCPGNLFGILEDKLDKCWVPSCSPSDNVGSLCGCHIRAVHKTVFSLGHCFLSDHQNIPLHNRRAHHIQGGNYHLGEVVTS